MKPEKALELVTRYAVLTKQIKALKETIGTSMDACKGFSGKRGDLDERGYWIQPRDENHKGREKDMHLWTWYQPEYDDDENASYIEITKAIHGSVCPHCYAAHLAIQQRKTARKSLSAVKAAMTRSFP